MAQWINVFRNNSFIYPMQLTLLCRNSRAVALAQLGLTAGWLAAWLTDEMWVQFQIFKIHYRSNFYTFAVFNKVTALLEQLECI